MCAYANSYNLLRKSERTATVSMAGDDIRQTISGQCQDTLFLGNHLSLGIHATPYSALDIRLENVSKMYNKH
jgi:hypothetical protein